MSERCGVACNPVMMTLARESRGWTQRELARAIGVTQATICKYELGLLRITDDDLAAIASTLDYDPALFEQTEFVSGLGGDFLYRRRARVSARARRRVQAEANIRKMQVARLLRAAQIEHDCRIPAIQPEEAGERPERIAREVRRAWRLDRGPIRSVTKAVETAGGIVFLVDFQSDLIDGTNLREPGMPPLIFVNGNAPGDRHRFNLAHELGHVVMHFATVLQDAEEQANAFAAEFLMPASDIRSDLRELDLAAAARLKAVWGVSMAALITRARDLSAITISTYRRLFTALSARGYRREEPLPIPVERPEVFDSLLAFHRDKLGLADHDMRRLLFTAELGPKPIERVPRLRLTDHGLFN